MLENINITDPMILLIAFVIALVGLYLATHVVVLAYLNTKAAYIRRLFFREKKMQEQISNIKESRKENGNGEKK